MLIEAAVETLGSALAAEQEGAGRLELCADLARGGTTPSAGLLRVVRARIEIPIMVMIRPRPGDFVFSAAEGEAMLADIAEARRAGADGVVIGLLGTDGAIERDWTLRLAEAARPLEVTFHRAVDQTPDVMASVELLARLGIDRVLTSGGAATASRGLKALGHLQQRFGDRIGVLPGGGIRDSNAAVIVRATGVRELHVGYPMDAPVGRVAAVVAAVRKPD